MNGENGHPIVTLQYIDSVTSRSLPRTMCYLYFYLFSTAVFHEDSCSNLEFKFFSLLLPKAKRS